MSTSSTWHASKGGRRNIVLADLTRKITKGTTPTTVGGRFVDNGINFLKVESISEDGALEQDKVAQIDEESNALLRRSQLEENDVLFSIAGAIGRTRLVGLEDLPANVNQALAIVRFDPAKMNPKYGYYAMRDRGFQGDALGRVVQTAQANVNLTQLANSAIGTPPLVIQHRIADILSAYDDLIENNRRRMALLEQAARQLYREWFVRLRFPGYEHTRITNGVPAGWSSGTIADFYDTTSGGTPSRSNPDFYSGDINWAKTQELNDNFIFETEERITEDALARSSAKLFPTDTLLVSIYGGSNIGRTAILAQPAATNQACCALFPRDARADFIYGALYFREQRQHLIGLAQGAAQTNISQQVIRSLPMRMAPEGLMTAFTGSLVPAFEQMKTLERQNEKLRAARDLLLPRLMSGEIAV